MFATHQNSKMSAEGEYFLKGLNKIRAAASKQTVGVPTTVYRETYRAWKVSSAPKLDVIDDVVNEKSGADDTRIGLFRVLAAISAGTPSDPPEEPLNVPRMSAWKTWIGTLAHLTFERFVSVQEVRAGVSEVSGPIKSELMEMTRQLREMALRWGEYGLPVDGDQDVTSTNALIRSIAFKLDLPVPERLSADQLIDLVGAGAPLEMASLLALSVYLCGKPINVEAGAVLAKRPKNLQDKFNHKSPWATMTGSLKMSRGTADRIGEAWELDPAFRHGYFRPMIKLPQSLSNPIANVVATMVSLLPFGQMTHVKIIFDFLRKYPFVTEMPTFSREMFILAADIDIIMEQPEHERLYAKILYRDQLKAFDAKTLVRLLSLAVDVMMPTEEHLEKYAVKGADTVVRAEFDRAKVKNDNRAASGAAATLGQSSNLKSAWTQSAAEAPKTLVDFSDTAEDEEEEDDEGAESETSRISIHIRPDPLA